MNKEQLEKEKAELERQITLNEEQIKTAQTAIHWLKKRVKLAERQIADLPAEQAQAEAAQEISEGLEKA